MIDISIVNGVYKPTYNWGAPPWISNHQMALEWDLQLSFSVKHGWDMVARNGCVDQS